MAEGGQRLPSIREIGPKWITAIAALITAVGVIGAGAGYGFGRNSTAQDGQRSAGTGPATTITRTITHTVTETPGRGGADHGSSSQRPDAGDDGDVYFAGELVWGEYNLDQAEPKPAGKRNIGWIGDEHLYVRDGDAVLAMWYTDSVPTWEQCRDRAAADGGGWSEPLVAGNRLCGRTDEGRVFRIEVLGVGSGGIRTRTTVWNKQPDE